MNRKKKKFLFSTLSLLLFLLVLITLFHLKPYMLTRNKLIVEFIDTGKSDSIFIKLPDGKSILADGGFSNSLPEIHDTLYKYNMHKIDYMIATHQHDDHIGSFSDILKIYDVKGIYMPASPIENGQLDNLKNEIEKNNIPLHFLKHGDAVIEENDISLKIIAPFSQDKYHEENDYSLVFILKYKDNSFLFMGDATRKIEFLLMKYYKEDLQKADVIKLGHHGSDTSSSYSFLEKISPRYAVATNDAVDKNKLSKNLLKKLNELEIKLYTTGKCGNITFVSNGKGLNVTTEK